MLILSHRILCALTLGAQLEDTAGRWTGANNDNWPGPLGEPVVSNDRLSGAS